MKIKSIFVVAIITLIMAAGLFAQGLAKSKMLVVCFSWSGTTEKAAQMIAKSTGADLFRIEPTEDYPTSYKALTDIVKKKLADGKIRTVKSAPPRLCEIRHGFCRRACLVPHCAHADDAFP